MKPNWFSRPGIASAFTPKLGIVQAWITSAAVIRRRISACMGRMARLSTSRSRYCPDRSSSVGSI